MKWDVSLSTKCAKQVRKLPDKVRFQLMKLLGDLENQGPVQCEWPHFSTHGSSSYHCHIKHGRPTYVVCWTADKKCKIIEVYYAGTHEKAPY